MRTENEPDAEQADAPNRRPALQLRESQVVWTLDSRPAFVSGGGR